MNPVLGTRASGGVSERARRRECVYGESVRGVACAVVVCGSWDPLVLLGPVLGPWVCFDDLVRKV